MAEATVRQALEKAGLSDVLVISVNEAGASIYSASELARSEFPDLDLTIRGAISIARRLQDPLSELIKIDPKSIGVGQYQHDVDQKKLQRCLQLVVESCVNRVGVDLNTASETLLSYVSGIGPKMAAAIVAHRNKEGEFKQLKELKAVRGLGAKTFEQCAGFLRIYGGSQPLDRSAVHPESYAVVAKMARDLSCSVAELIGNEKLLSQLEVRHYCAQQRGESSVRELILELQKPGRDPRADFSTVTFREDLHSIEDLEVGMELDGLVTNVTHFGAFVDIGVHRDGLVHISELSERRIASPHELVHPGKQLRVRVIEIDVRRKRISLSARIK